MRISIKNTLPYFEISYNPLKISNTKTIGQNIVRTKLVFLYSFK